MVLNADELFIYDGEDGRELFFDPSMGTYRFMGELNINDKFVVDKTGDVEMTGGIDMDGSIKIAGNINISSGNITWGNQGPVKYQYSVNGSFNWHDNMTANDKYRRDSLDGGTTWGNPYQFVGEDRQDGRDGKDGSDADVPSYIKDTYIDSVTIRSSITEANDFYVYPNSVYDRDGSFNIYGMYNQKQWHFLRILYSSTASIGYPGVIFDSPDGAYALW